MATSQARERLLAAAVGHALDTGIADLSLRQLAAAIGTIASPGEVAVVGSQSLDDGPSAAG